MLKELNKKLAEVQQGKANMQNAIANLDRQREQAVANLNAFVGAEQVILQLIEEITKKESEGKDDETDNS